MTKCERCGKETGKLVHRRGRRVCEQCASQIFAVMNEAFERVMNCELPYPVKQENGVTTVTFHSKDDAVLAAVMREVEKQEVNSAFDDELTYVDWVNILDELLEEFEFGTILSEQMEKLVEIAAVCISALRSIERRASAKEA